jgi:hypothetical protein
MRNTLFILITAAIALLIALAIYLHRPAASGRHAIPSGLHGGR